MSRKSNGIDFNGEILEIIPPAPTENERGGIKAKAKGSGDTVEIKLGSDGKLYAPSYPVSDTEVAVQNDTPSEGKIWINPDGNEDDIILAEIDDNETSDEKTWSSKKISEMFTEYVDEIAELVGGDA